MRKHRKLTQEDLGNKIGVRKQQVWNYENGKAGIDLELLEQIAKAIEVNPEELISSTEYSPEKAELISLIKQAPDDLVSTLLGIAKPLIEARIGVANAQNQKKA